MGPNTKLSRQEQLGRLCKCFTLCLSSPRCVVPSNFVWSRIEEIAFSDAEFESEPASLAGAIPANESVLLVAIEVNGPGFSGLIELVYPVQTIEPVMEKLKKRER